MITAARSVPVYRDAKPGKNMFNGGITGPTKTGHRKIAAGGTTISFAAKRARAIEQGSDCVAR
jgi:hypothetical protein